MRKPQGKPGFLSGEDRNRTTYKFPGKLTLRHHARREIRRAPISLFETTRNTIHRDQPATSLQPDLQGHEFETDPNIQGHRFPFAGSFTGSHQKPLRIYGVTISIYRVTGLEFRLRFTYGPEDVSQTCIARCLISVALQVIHLAPKKCLLLWFDT